METLEEKIARVVKEDVAVVPYDPHWPEMFEQERLHLLSCLPDDLVKRIEHFGSTAVPGLPAKPIVDILVEVSSLDETKQVGWYSLSEIKKLEKRTQKYLAGEITAEEWQTNPGLVPSFAEFLKELKII